jgi:hypothetical protein
MRLRNAEISSIVEAGGGKCVGVLMAIPQRMESVILFISLQTRTTLGIPISRLTVEAVRDHLAESNTNSEGLWIVRNDHALGLARPHACTSDDAYNAFASCQ